jgi:GNAT superfamily N-acetyltransferase
LSVVGYRRRAIIPFVTTVSRATRADVEAAANVLAEAFRDDPGFVIIEPDSSRRARLLPVFFANFVAASLAEDADIVVAGEPVAGVASWFGPDRFGPSPDALGAHGFGDVAALAGEDALGRLLALVGQLEQEHAELIDGLHFRLEFFGVLPAAQRTGIGSSLMKHGHRRADEQGLPCYLETFTTTNVNYYQRRGYNLVREFAVARNVRAYAMVRPAPVSS